MRNLFVRIFGEKKLGLAEIGFAGVLRVVPHPANFSPLGGLALYSGARLDGWRAFAAPIVVYVITGLVLAALGGYSFAAMTSLVVVLACCFSVLIGRLVRKTESVLAIGGATLGASLQFFFVTNLGVWAFDGMYPLTGAGLATCFIAALPFYGMTLAGDLVYAGLLFGAHHFLARSYFPQEAVQTA